MEGPKETGEPCPVCGIDKDGKPKEPSKSGGGKLVVREGRFGTFISCSRYPKCKYIKEDPAELARKMTDVTCPVCNKGKMMERRGRFGIFYSCSNYPDCKNAIKAKPTGNICTMCGSLMMEGTKTIPERCSNKACPNHNPHKLEKTVKK
jgi:ssDNA-binding Zn-finger/Zn-ribbon topoisomerase 1